jgi:hypothetical protein
MGVVVGGGWIDACTIDNITILVGQVGVFCWCFSA